MKALKKAVALMLCAVMTLGIFAVAGVTFDDLAGLLPKVKAADITLGGITQTRVVSNYESIYAGYQNRFFTGSESNEPTNFVIPGLSSSNDYTPQGMTYWEAKEWILISAYDASGSGKHSVIYAIDAVTTEFVALFKILNANGSVNTSHGGGIAASTYNFYYADTGSNISYFPLSEMDVPKGTVKEIKLRGSINCGGELGGAATSYCCYEDGVLWAGNFYYDGDDRYKTSAHSASNSMIVGYRLHGDSSAEEWYYLSTNYNLIKLNTDSTANQTSGTMTFKTFNTDGANAEVRGTIATDTALGEVTYNFCSLNLVEGKKYKIEFIADNNQSDLYMFAPNGGGHCNVKQSTSSKITNLGNGKYHYQMIFTAGLKPTGADSLWPTTQSTNGTYTGTYTMRFDQDNVPAGGRTFNMTDISVTEYVEPNGFEPNSKYEGTGCAGNPTYVVMIAGIDKIQYAMVYKGKFYISRSWKRTSGTNHTRELMIGDIDLNSPGSNNLVVNGRTRPCHMINLDNVTRFGGDNGSSNLNQMLYMGEALCVMDDFLYMFGEGAAWAYNGKESDNKCPEPIDVIWKIDQHMIMGEERTYDDTAPQYYEKVNSLSEINLNDDYLIVHESSVKDPVTQRNILYAFDSYGGYGKNKLPKQDAGTQANSADSMGMVGYEIKNYSVDTLDNGKQIIHVPEEVDTTKSLHWQIQGATTGNLRLNNKDLYYAKNNHLYFGSRLFAMTTDSRSNLNLLTLEQVGTGDFRLYYKGNSNYYLWCNDGSNQSYIDTYSNYYSNHGKTGYVPQYHGLEEVPGTFHCDADKLHAEAENSGNYIGKSVGMDMQIIHIYKRVADPYSSAYDTRVSTDLTAELQADGTYNIKMETYAISELQFQTVAERPTDFIFVLDGSASMTNNTDARGYHTEIQNWSALKMNQAAGDKSDSFFGEGDNYNTAHKSKFYYKFPDGEFGSIYVAFNKKDSSYTRDIWLWAEHPISKRCYRLSKFGFMTHGNFSGGADWDQDSSYRITEANFLANQASLGWANQAAVISDVKADKNRTDYHSSRNSTNKRANYEVMNYQYTNDYGDTRASYYSYGDCYRLLAMQQAVEELTYKIADESAKTGFNHRIAVVTYGSDGNESWSNTGMYTNTSVSMVQYSGTNSISDTNYQKAFYDTSNFAQVRRIINNINTANRDHDTYSNYGFEMANNIITKSDANYLADGNRSAVIIMITDGVPGIGNNNASVANSTANSAISEAYKSKHQGAYVYTVQMGNDSASGFDMDKYMDYVSSEFIYAESMTNPGDRNTKDIAYRLNVPTGSSFNITNLVDGVYESVTSNSTNAIATLNANSILREHLTDAFVIPSDAKTTIQVAKHNYDGLGRLYFEDPTTASGITANLNRTNNEITVTGYDYSTRYVAKSNVGKGDKLIVTISGVIANADAELLNTSINQTGTTAIYQNNSFMAKNSAVKQFPTEHFTIPEYTYYMDYDIPMYDSDINGTLCSVDSTLKKQSTYKDELSTGNMGIKFINGNQDMIYTLNSQAGLTEKLSKGYVLIQRDDGTYDWFRLNIVPASTVYYEENKMETLDGTQSYTAWTEHGNYTNKFQSLSSNEDVFGNDPIYRDSKETFSLGTHKEVSVSSSNNRSDTQSFTFTGVGFDLISACGNNTGIQTVTVKQHQADGTMKIVKVFMVDTFYNDSAYGTVCQVPVVQFKSGYGTYTVETTAAYYSFSGALKTQSIGTQAIDGTEIEATTGTVDTALTDELFAQVGMDELIGQDVELIWMDDDSVLNGGSGVESGELSTQAVTSLVNYIDGFRIYNPIDYNDEYIVSEKNATFYSVIDAITAGGMGGDGLAAYIEPGASGEINFGNYLTSGGPKYEVYLAPNNSIAFRFKADDFKNNDPRAMVSVRAASGSPKAKFGVTDVTSTKEFAVNSASETYYDITDILGVDTDGSFTLTITNTGNGLLAVDNLKLVNATLVPMNGVSLAELNDIISTQAIEVDPATFSFARPTAKYPDYVPGTPATEADPGLDEEGSIPDYVPPSEPEETPDVSEPEVTVPEVTEPEVTVPETTIPEVTVPGITEPGTTVPEVTEPEETVPDATEPSTEDSTSSEETPDDETKICWLKEIFIKVINFFKMIISYIKNIFISI